MLFAEATDRVERIAADTHACPADGRGALGQHQSSEVPGRKPVEILPMRIPHGPSDTEDEARMLDGEVGVEEFGADRSDPGVLQYPDHLFEPRVREHLDVVMDEEKEVPAGGRHSQIALGRIADVRVMRNHRESLSVVA